VLAIQGVWVGKMSANVPGFPIETFDWSMDCRSAALDTDDACCPFFHRPSRWPHTHHIHVVKAGGDEERRTLAFRDYLRDHKDDARKYERLKLEIAAQLNPTDDDSRELYARAKTDFIERIIAIALSDGYPQGLT